MLLRCLLLVCLCLLTSHAYSKTVIRVGGYEFPPFVDTKSTASYHGATLDLIAAFNRIQDEYQFEFFPTSPKRRYLDFAANRYDLIMFENLDWGWADYPVEASRVFMTGREVYIAYNRDDRDQQFFDAIAGKRLVGMLGYHYQFADFNADEAFLARNFQILLSTDHYRNIRLILVDRPELAEIAIVTQSFLRNFLNRYPEHRKELLVSEKYDQEYRHRILMRESGKITVSQINQLLDQLQRDGTLQQLREQYGLAD